MSNKGPCAGADCSKKAAMRCPTCIKLHVEEGSYFCSQACFKANWGTHKAAHAKAKLMAQKLKELNRAEGIDISKEEVWPDYEFSGPLRPYGKTPKRLVPPHIARPDYADDPEGRPFSEFANKNKLRTLNPAEIAKMRKVCKFGREVLDLCGAAIKPGITTDEIDRICHEASIDRDCYPSPLNYHNFPKSCCTSVNEVICHGIPDGYVLKEGDIVNVDISLYHDGFHADLNETFLVGEVDEKTMHLVKTTYETLDLAIKACKPGMRYRDLGNIISKHAHKNKLSVVRTYCGHGVNNLFHCAPNVPHYAKNKAIGTMKPGHTFTIEPMINQGTWMDQTWLDDWTSTTTDGKLSAQFEHTLLVTETGVEVLTARTESSPTGPMWFQSVLEERAENGDMNEGADE